jgi:hypothetical protein
MKNVKTLVFLLYLYLIILICESVFFIKNIDFIVYKLIPIIFLFWLSIYIYFIVINIINTVILYRQNNISELRKNAKIIKLTLIPFWILHFILSAIIIFIFLGISRGMGIIFVPIPIFFTYILLLITSIFSITYILLLNKNKYLKHYYVHILLQLCFVIDIIDIIYLFRKINLEKNNIL